MANICIYKIKVKGTKKSCYKLINMMPLYSYEKEIIDEFGNDNDFTLIFSGDCKWSVDSYTKKEYNLKPYTDEELDKIEDGFGWNYTLQDKSILLGVEIFCNSKDIDDCCYANYVHYNKGNEMFDECPKELHIKRGRDYDNGYDITLTIPILTNQTNAICKVRFEDNRSYWYIGDYEIGDLVYVEGAKSNQLGKVTAKAKFGEYSACYIIKEKVGYVGEFFSKEIENIWYSYKAKERKEYLKKMGFDENITKNKFLALIENKWNDFYQKDNDWNNFLETLNL